MSNAPDLNARDFAFNQVMAAARAAAPVERADGGGILFRAGVVAVIASAIVFVRNWLTPAAATPPPQVDEEMQLATHQPPLHSEDGEIPEIQERAEDQGEEGEEPEGPSAATLPSILQQYALFHASIPIPQLLPFRRTGHNDNAIDLAPPGLGAFDTLVFRPAALVMPANSGSGSGGTGGGGSNGGGPGNGNDVGEAPRRNSAPVVSGPVLLGSVTLSSAMLIGLSDLLRNAHDSDGDGLAVAALTVSSGRITQLPGGNFLFVSGREDAGTVTFTYKITDGVDVVTSKALLHLEAPGGPLQGPSGSSRLIGTAGADTLVGTPDPDVIDAMDGDDLVIGRESRDIIFGGAGHDRIIAGDGDDIVLAGAGNDVVFGGKGDDTLLGEEGDDVLLGEEGEDTLVGGEGDDVLVGGKNSDRIDGGAGRDLIVAEAGDGNDVIDGGDGADTLDLAGTSAAAVIDLLAGRAWSADIGQDALMSVENAIGGAGNDILVASSDSNELTGGAGDDIFVFRTVASIGRGAGRDRIMDFEAGDKIDLDDIAKGLENAVGDAFQHAIMQRFVLLGANESFSKPGQLKFAYEAESTGPSSYTLLMGNVDDDVEADFEIEIHGPHQFTMDDLRGHA